MISQYGVRRDSKEYMKKWAEAHPDYFRNYNKKWKNSHPKLLKGQKRRSWAKWADVIIEKREELKREVLAYYGGGKCACGKCGFDDIRALSLDHVNNDGATERNHRRDSYNGGLRLYSKLRRQGFPDKERYQTLCYNCNTIKHFDYLKEQRLKRNPSATIEVFQV